MSKTSTYPLRLPASLKAAAEKLSKDDGTSLNQFVVMAVAEKISAMQTATFFDDRANVADRKAFLNILKRKDGEAPRAGDEVDS